MYNKPRIRASSVTAYELYKLQRSDVMDTFIDIFWAKYIKFYSSESINEFIIYYCPSAV